MNALRGYFQRVRISRFTFGAVYAEECSRTVTNKNIRLITMGGGKSNNAILYNRYLFDTVFTDLRVHRESNEEKEKIKILILRKYSSAANLTRFEFS